MKFVKKEVNLDNFETSNEEIRKDNSYVRINGTSYELGENVLVIRKTGKGNKEDLSIRYLNILIILLLLL